MAALTAVGSGSWAPALLGDPEGWLVLVTAPAAALAAGIVAGLIAAVRDALLVGFLLALVGLAVGLIVATLSWGPGAGVSTWLHILAALAGIPFAAAYGAVALGRTAWGRDLLLWASWDFLAAFLRGRR